MVSEALPHTIVLTSTDLVTNAFTTDGKAMADHLATALTTVPSSPLAGPKRAALRAPGGEIKVPFDKFFPLEARAVDLAMIGPRVGSGSE
jgi:hypothetical protein